jgi:preprotein translocase subunit SecE
LVAKAGSEKKNGSERKINVQNNRAVAYLRETWFELKKVSWPTRSEAINLTVIVVSVTSFLAVVLGVIDWVFSRAFGLFL